MLVPHRHAFNRHTLPFMICEIIRANLALQNLIQWVVHFLKLEEPATRAITQMHPSHRPLHVDHNDRVVQSLHTTEGCSRYQAVGLGDSEQCPECQMVGRTRNKDQQPSVVTPPQEPTCLFMCAVHGSHGADGGSKHRRPLVPARRYGPRRAAAHLACRQQASSQSGGWPCLDTNSG